MPNPVLIDANSVNYSSMVTQDFFGVVVRHQSVDTNTETNPGGNAALAWDALSDGAIRFPGGEQQLDFTNPAHLEALDSVLNYCKANELALSFTIQVENFWNQGSQSVDMPNEYEELLRTELFEKASSMGVEITRIQFGNEVTAGNFASGQPNDGWVSNWAPRYAESVKAAMEAVNDALIGLDLDPDFILDAPSVSMSDAQFRAFSQAFRDVDAEFFNQIDGIDLHNFLTLEEQYDAYLGDRSGDGHISYVGARGRDFIAAWEDEYLGGRSADWDIHISAWSYPREIEEGGAGLQNAGIGILALHEFSLMGASSASAFALSNYGSGLHNSLWYRQGEYLRAGGLALNMMENSIEGMTAILIDDGLTDAQELDAGYFLRGFANDTQTVIYVINRENNLFDETISIENLLFSFEDYANGTGGTASIALVSAERLMLASGSVDDPTSQTVLTNAGFGLSLPGDGVEVTLGAHEIAELTVQLGLFGDASDNIITGRGADDFINGRNGDDTLSGAAGNDTIYGGEGGDILNGDAGSDFLFGDAGDDTLSGGAGDDTLCGGLGADVFVFQADGGSDIVTDFDVWVDTLDIRGLTSGISSVSINLNGLTSERILCFGPHGFGGTEIDDLVVNFVQSGDRVEAYAAYNYANGGLANEELVFVLEETNLIDISMSNFLF